MDLSRDQQGIFYNTERFHDVSTITILMTWQNLILIMKLRVYAGLVEKIHKNEIFCSSVKKVVVSKNRIDYVRNTILGQTASLEGESE